MADPKDRRKFENILREPLTRHRLLLNAKLRAAQNPENAQPFTLDNLRDFMANLPNNSEEYKKETLNVIEAVTTGKAPQEPKFDSPEKQLIWGAAIAYLTLNPEQKQTWAKPPAAETPLQGTELWQQITGTEFAYSELLSHAHYIREALRDKDMKYAWGEPGSNFTYDRTKKVINIDFMQSLIVGFEHARADVNREIGHSMLSVSYPKRMREVYKEMAPLMKKSRAAQAKKGPQLKPEEYKKLRMLSAEWQLRHMMFAAAEENVANKFVSNLGNQVLQDFGVSLNNTAVTHRGVGLMRLPEDGMSPELKRYMNLCNTVQLSFFQNNGLFEDTDAGWDKVGIDPGLVRKTATLAARPEDQKDDADGINHADFKYLRELCGGPKGLENLQPKQHERLFGWANLANRVARADEDRKAIIEEIWKLYGEDLIQNVLKQTNDQVDEQLKEAQEKQKQKGQDGEDQDQDGQDGDDGQDGQDGDDGQEGQKGQKGKKGKGKGKKQRGQPQGDPGDADDSDDADGDDQDQDGQKGDKQKKDKNKKDKGKKGDKGEKGDKGDEEGDPQDGEGQDGEDADGEKQEGKGKGKKEGELGADEDETVPVEGAGDMPAPDQGAETPGDEVDPNGQGQDGEDADGEDADGEDADGEDADDGMTADELEKELEKQKQKGEKGEDGEDADGQDGDGDADGQKQGKGKSKSKSKQAGHGDGRSLEELSKLSWEEYGKRVAELAGPISRVRKLFKGVQERQLQRKRAISPTLDILPENGEVKDRFNQEAHKNLTIKKLTHQVEEGDLKRFHKDEVKMVPTEIDIVIMIDGSGSMNGTPLQSALQSAAIMFEAASGKDMKMNVYVGMWGDSDPPMLIFPGADRVEIGKAMAKAQKGLNSGTDLAPAIKKVAKTIGEQRGRSGTLSGFTHVLIISDGDMFDNGQAKEKIMTMFEYCDKVTVDTAIIGRKGTSMEQMAKSIKGHKTFQDVGVAVGSDPNQIPMDIVGLLLEKVRKCGSFTAVPNSQKRRAMQKAHNKMDRKP